MKNWLVIILGLIATSSAIANPIDYSSIFFTQFKDSAPKKQVAPPDDHVDLNENYLNRDYFASGDLVWTQPLQYLLNHIQASVALPQTLLRTFISVAEKSLKPKKDNYPISPDRYPENSIARLFIQESISAAFYHLKGNYQLPYQMGLLLSDGSESLSAEALREVQRDSTTKRGTVQILFGDVGASGVSSLVTEYAKASGRQLEHIHAGWHFVDIRALAAEIQGHVRQGNAPILYFDQLNRYPDEILEAVAALTENRALIGNASLIVSFKPDAFGGTNRNLLNRIVSSSEALHTVGHPRSWHYYADFIRINLPAVLNLIARKNQHNKNLILMNEESTITQLANASWNIQEDTGRSLFRELDMILRNPDIDYSDAIFDGLGLCGNFLRSRSRSSSRIGFYEAVTRYQSAVRESLGTE
ncbi:MAG: hypothetical protein IPJ71_13085 [Bdellovibrionales bacterium]|nr:hypothetical protein [Bdellovibrionales bacterium]